MDNLFLGGEGHLINTGILTANGGNAIRMTGPGSIENRGRLFLRSRSRGPSVALADGDFAHCIVVWLSIGQCSIRGNVNWAGADLNRRHTDFETVLTLP